MSTVINLSLQAESAQKAADVLNELLKEYMRRTVESENQLAASTLMFVEQRLKDVEDDLDSIERRIQQFRTAKGVIDLSQQGRIYLESVAENDRGITTINTQLAVLDQVDRFLNAQGQQTGIIPTTLGINDPVLSQLLQRLNDLELQRANLRTTAGEENPLVTSVESEIQKIRPNIRSIVANQRSRLVASRNNLAATSNRFGSNIQNIPAQERELLEISRQQEVKRDLYSFLLQRREEAALSNSSNIANSQVIDWADPNAAPANSKKMLFLLGGIIAAFAAAIAYIIFREALNNKVLFRSTIESLTVVPVIGEILYRKKRSPLLLMNPEQKPALAQFRQLQAALGLFENVIHHKKILVTSSVFNEGKTFVSSHLAVSLALSGKKVVLLDCNFYNPEASEIFSLQQTPGIKDFLQGKYQLSDLVKTTAVPDLYILPAGSQTNNPLSLLGKEKLTELVAYLEQQYDHVIFDSPPVELATDAYILAGVCDMTLFVVRHGVTPKTLIRKLDENPRIAQIANMKIVFNGIRGRGLIQKFYGFGFGYGREKVFNKKAYLKAS